MLWQVHLFSKTYFLDNISIILLPECIFVLLVQDQFFWMSFFSAIKEYVFLKEQISVNICIILFLFKKFGFTYEYLAYIFVGSMSC